MLTKVKSYKLQLDYKDETFNRIFPTSQNPLNIEKIAVKKDLKGKGSQSLIKDFSKYSTTKTIQTAYESKKEKTTFNPQRTLKLVI